MLKKRCVAIRDNANHEDTDSDGDECLDAIEGGGGFTDDDISDERLDGDEDDDGVPLIANGGQSIGESQDIELYSARIDVCPTIVTNPHVLFYKRN